MSDVARTTARAGEGTLVVWGSAQGMGRVRSTQVMQQIDKEGELGRRFAY